MTPRTPSMPPAHIHARHALALVPLVAALWLAGCASGGSAGDPAADMIPEGAIETIRTEPNGDVVTEYRVAGQLRVLKVTSARGLTYYLYDRNNDGVVDNEVDGVQPVYFKLFGWD